MCGNGGKSSSGGFPLSTSSCIIGVVGPDPIDILLDVIGDLCYEIKKGAQYRKTQRLCMEPIFAITRYREDWIGLCWQHAPTGGGMPLLVVEPQMRLRIARGKVEISDEAMARYLG